MTRNSRRNQKQKQPSSGFDEPFCVIGERINPTGRKKLAAELEAGDFSTVENLTRMAQADGGCDRSGYQCGRRLQLEPQPERDRTAADDARSLSWYRVWSKSAAVY